MARQAFVEASIETLVDRVEVRLREDIINGVWLPGARLGVEELRRRYETGATPLREALSRLLVEGLVVLINNRGYRVPALNHADLLDISRSRAVIEAAAAREAAERGGDAWEARLIFAFHLLERRAARDLSEPAPTQSYYDAHHEFHAALLAGCQSVRLMAMQAVLEHQHSRYYRQLPFARIAAEDLIGEHRRVLDLALAHDGAALADRIGRHVMLTVERLDPATFDRAFICEVAA